ncbi:4-hydroxy-tetrahydrodipicolinate reductase [Methanobacterium formicicum]|uniref:4-hydroxy-tetrahydrodipicolinate reductase n=1 Tax=Methanobacterium formicicum (strain DSM 3637 / PP1) TaxID=1204725 RepID=K2QD83_METFP|nr:4-hydroxy-tetrahydrodipicolinate reductase [Methanobacterium formicicum]EKF85981.1 dihydrodipicolinate reductase [Methanobacterium formicicum DSM 3637]
MIKIAVTGAGGRISSKIIRNILKQEDMEVVAAIGAPNTPLEGKDVGDVIGSGKINVPITGAERLAPVLNERKADVLVDFTIANSAVRTIQTAAECGVNVVVGTTGLSNEQMALITESIEENNIKAVISPNMAVGVNVFFKIIKDLAKTLSDCDIEIIEAHHKHKVDAPSGTACKAYEIIARELERVDELERADELEREEELEREDDKLEKVNDVSCVCGRRGMVGARSPGEIGVHAIRGGDIVGDHTVLFAGEGERLEITHRAGTRQAFVTGAIKAVRYVVTKAPEGKISDMADVLGLKV